MQKITKAISAGIVSGIILGLFLKVIELTTTLKVYTLLLNVDYIPVINTVKLPELVEFILHLIVSIILSIFLLYFFKNRKWDNNKIIPFTILFSIIIGILLYPTTALSTRTPSITSLPSFSFWLVGHALYGWVLGYLLKIWSFRS